MPTALLELIATVQERIPVTAAPVTRSRDAWNPLLHPRDPLIKIDRKTRTFRALVAPFQSCILNGRERPGVCRRPPRDGQGYAYAHTGGDKGVIGRNQDHANPHASYSAAAAHYANSGTATFIASYYEDDDDTGGIWATGKIIGSVTDDDMDVLEASALSGDWRWIEEERRLRMIATQVVNTPGFRKAYDEQAFNYNFALVASASGGGHDISLITSWEPSKPYPEEEKLLTPRQRLSRIIGEAAGAISVQWENIDKAGVFQSTNAGVILRDAIEHVLRLRLDSITAAVTQARVGKGSSTGGQFARAGGGAGAGAAAPAPPIAKMTRQQLLTRMSEAGYSGPTSYSQTKLRQIADEHLASRSTVSVGDRPAATHGVVKVAKPAATGVTSVNAARVSAIDAALGTINQRTQARQHAVNALDEEMNKNSFYNQRPEKISLARSNMRTMEAGLKPHRDQASVLAKERMTLSATNGSVEYDRARWSNASDTANVRYNEATNSPKFTRARDRYVAADTPTLMMNRELRGEIPPTAGGKARAREATYLTAGTLAGDTRLNRTVELNPAAAAAMKPGSVFESKGFQSTQSGGPSGYDRSDKTFGTVHTNITILAPKGTNAADVGYGEVVLRPGSMRVVEANWDGTSHNVTMEIIND